MPPIVDEFLTRLDVAEAFYLVTVLVVGLFAVVRVRRALSAATQKRRMRLESRRRFDAVATDSPLDEPSKVAQKRAISLVEEQSRATRRIVIPGLLVLVGFAAVVPFLGGVPASILSLVIGATTVLLVIAARPMVENAIAGLVLAFSRALNIGDTVVIDDHFGTVEEITFTHTTIKIWDWRRYVIPNSRMLQIEFLNYSLIDRFQWAYVEFWVAYEADLDRVAALAGEAARASPFYRDYEPPRFWVMEMAPQGIRCWVAAWADSPADAWQLKNDIRTSLARALRAEGIAAHTYRHDLRVPLRPRVVAD